MRILPLLALASSPLWAATLAAAAEVPVESGFVMDAPSPAAAIVTGARPGFSFEQRLKYLAICRRALTAADRAAFNRFLWTPVPAGVANADECDALKNDVADVLLEVAKLPANEPEAWLLALESPGHGVVWRNYVIQKMDTVWTKTEDTAVRRRIYNTLIATLRSKEASLPGTALLTLRRLGESAGTGQAELGAWAMAIVADQSAPWQDQVTALQVAAESRAPGTLKAARAWANQADAPINLRMSALAALGIMGEAEDARTLSTFISSDELRLRTAATEGLKRMRARGVRPYGQS